MAISKFITLQSPLDIQSFIDAIDSGFEVENDGFWEKKMKFRGKIEEKEFLLTDGRFGPKTPKAILRGWFYKNDIGTFVRIELEPSSNILQFGSAIYVGFLIPAGFIGLIFGILKRSFWGIIAGLFFIVIAIVLLKSLTHENLKWEDESADKLFALFIEKVNGKILSEEIK